MAYTIENRIVMNLKLAVKTATQGFIVKSISQAYTYRRWRCYSAPTDNGMNFCSQEKKSNEEAGAGILGSAESFALVRGNRSTSLNSIALGRRPSFYSVAFTV